MVLILGPDGGDCVKYVDYLILDAWFLSFGFINEAHLMMNFLFCFCCFIFFLIRTNWTYLVLRAHTCIYILICLNMSKIGLNPVYALVVEI